MFPPFLPGDLLPGADAAHWERRGRSEGRGETKAACREQRGPGAGEREAVPLRDAGAEAMRRSDRRVRGVCRETRGKGGRGPRTGQGERNGVQDGLACVSARSERENLRVLSGGEPSPESVSAASCNRSASAKSPMVVADPVGWIGRGPGVNARCASRRSISPKAARPTRSVRRRCRISVSSNSMPRSCRPAADGTLPIPVARVVTVPQAVNLGLFFPCLAASFRFVVY